MRLTRRTEHTVTIGLQTFHLPLLDKAHEKEKPDKKKKMFFHGKIHRIAM
jgi:hypothetical protein